MVGILNESIINSINCRISRDADSAFVVDIKAGCCILNLKDKKPFEITS